MKKLKSIQNIKWSALVCSFISSGFLMSESSNAYALDVTVLGTASSSSYSISPAPTVLSGGSGFGLGATIGFDVFPFFELETGVLFESHSFSNTVSTYVSTITNNYFQIPVLLRCVGIPFVSIEGGFYYGIPSSASITGTVAPALSGTSPSYKASHDAGLMVGAGLKLPLLPLTSLRLDILYEYGLTNLSTGTSTQYARNIDIWAGVMLGLL
jgi:hypothetical protein